jgi:capsular polysaccharide biosynthesis protein
VKKRLRVLGILFIALAVFTPLVTMMVTFILPETFASSAMILHPVTNLTSVVTAVEMVHTRSNLDLAITQLDLAAQWGIKYRQPDKLSPEKCREMLKRMSQIQLRRGTPVVEIRVFSDNKDEAATIANQLAKLYLRTTPGASVIEAAAPNSTPVLPNKQMNLSLSLFVGVTFLVVGFGLLIASRIAVKRQ